MTRTIIITDQSDYNNLQTTFNQALTGNVDCINIVFNSRQLSLSTPGCTLSISPSSLVNSNILHNLKINIIGNNTEIIGGRLQDLTPQEGNSNDSVPIEDGYFSKICTNFCAHKAIMLEKSGNLLSDFYGPLYAMKGKIQLLDGSSYRPDTNHPGVNSDHWVNEFRIVVEKDFIDSFSSTALQQNQTNEYYIQIYNWFYSQIYKVSKIDMFPNEAIIYFFADQYQPMDGSYPFAFNPTSVTSNPNYGHETFSSSLKQSIFRLINAPYKGKAFYYKSRLFSKSSEAWLCNNSIPFISFSTLEIKSLSISGFFFNGFSNMNNDAIINIDNLNCENFSIKNCTFSNIKCHGIRITKAGNVKISCNSFSNYYRSAVLVQSGAEINIDHNNFDNGNLRQNNEGAIVCYAYNYKISYNKLRNFGYMGIGVGAYWRVSEEQGIIGTVDYNELYNSPDYRHSFGCLPLMDGGSIYTFGQHNNTKILHNFISGSFGYCKNRGIFCDDGTNHVTVQGNMIINTGNHYSFELWENNSVTLDERNKSNIFTNNIIDCSYKFVGRSGVSNNGCQVGHNLRLARISSNEFHNEIQNVDTSHVYPDQTLNNCVIDEHDVYVPVPLSTIINALNTNGFTMSEFILSHIKPKNV